MGKRHTRHEFWARHCPGRVAFICDGPRRRLSSPLHNAWPENRSTAVPGRCGISPRLLPHVTANPELYAHTAVARMIDQANGSDDGPHRRLASVASKSAGRAPTGCRLTPDHVPVLARHNGAMAGGNWRCPTGRFSTETNTHGTPRVLILAKRRLLARRSI
jgi:hypothetical protein